MNLLKATGTIGGLTMVSRVLGFARDMIGSRLLGASNANDAFNLAFLLPNIFRRLFAEGAFSSGFVPLFSRRLGAGGHEDAQAFSNEILAVFMPALLLVTIVFVIFMPGLLADRRRRLCSDTPGKMELAVELTRWTFPYLLFISLVALAVGRAQFADPLRRRRLRAGPAQRRADHRAAGRAAQRRSTIVRVRWRLRCSPAASSSSPCAGSRCAAPASGFTSAGRG